MIPAFVDITPAGGLLRQPEPGGGSAVAGLGEALYVIELLHNAGEASERWRMLGYDQARQRWDTLSDDGVSIDDPSRRPTAGPTAVDCIVLGEPAAARETLYVRLRSPLGSRIMQGTDAGGLQPVAGTGALVEHCFGLSRIVALEDGMFGLDRNRSTLTDRISEYLPERDDWRPIDLPENDGGERPAISELIGFAGALYAATTDAERGLTLWRREAAGSQPIWEPVFEQGAWRYAHNREALALRRHGDALYLIAGTDPAARTPHSKFIDYRGFEVIRIDADGTWDLLVGEPRFSPGGLVLPFSGLGAGMQSSLGLEPLTSWSLGDHLYLGLYGIQGLQFWRSTDGEDWSCASQPDLAALYRLERCRAIVVGQVVALELTAIDAVGRHSRMLWAGHPDAAFADAAAAAPGPNLRTDDTSP